MCEADAVLAEAMVSEEINGKMKKEVCVYKPRKKKLKSSTPRDEESQCTAPDIRGIAAGRGCLGDLNSSVAAHTPPFILTTITPVSSFNDPLKSLLLTAFHNQT